MTADPCVCGSPRARHWLGFGPCDDRAHYGCPRYESDSGEPIPKTAIQPDLTTDPYTGIYSGPYQFDQETA